MTRPRKTPLEALVRVSDLERAVAAALARRGAARVSVRLERIGRTYVYRVVADARSLAAVPRRERDALLSAAVADCLGAHYLKFVLLPGAA